MYSDILIALILMFFPIVLGLTLNLLGFWIQF